MHLSKLLTRARRPLRHYLPYAASIAVAVYAERVGLETLRNCVRNNVNSAVVRRPGSADPNAAFRNPGLYPILDCKRSQLLGRPISLPGAQAKRYINIVANGQAPIVNNGRVIGARTAILAGIRSVNQAGSRP